MKKLVTLLLTASMVFALAGSALAAGKLSVEQENFHVVDSYSIYGYAYAKVKNVGDKPIKVNAGLLEIFDENGDTLTSEDYVHAYAENLQPDEYTYVYMYENIDNVESADEVDDYMLTITGKSDVDEMSCRLPVETAYEEGVENGWWTYDYMYASVTNDSEDTIYEMEVVLVLLDEEDNILYMEDQYLYDIGLAPGSTVVIRKEVPNNFKEYFEANGLKPVKVDAIAYVDVDIE